MKDKLEEYRVLKSLFSAGDKIIVALSGGRDSAVLLHLLNSSGYKVAAAHCNFQLRGEESEEDEKFVEKYCGSLNVKLYKTRFATSEYAEKHGISIQMAARDLRYEWLEKIRSVEGYDLIAIGHNLNDSVETLLINLIRGTGLKGLTGIKEKTERVIRPLLFASREIIDQYIRENRLEYREDSSNSETKYTRNKIRHNVLPIFRDINPSFLESIDETTEHLSSAWDIYKSAIREKKNEIVKGTESRYRISTDSLSSLQHRETWIFEIFRDWGFGRLQAKEISDLLKSPSGKQLHSDTHTITRDRTKLLITVKSKKSPGKIIEIKSPEELKDSFLTDNAEIIKADKFSLISDNNYACLDASMISFPITIRKWEEGDYFYPLGMKGRKKISDFLVDIKVPLPDKDSIYVLEMNGKIIWVAGYRIDNRFRVKTSSTDILLIRKRQD
ncbi:MAG TPA: tRNA lysidine(34) synthetase TilS [Bacteroidales bacterium]|nr:tRNA lysidine(34) synthetase TilS [Bacteroidales bacterium]